MAVVYGFLGLRVKEDGFYFTPSLPEPWNSYRVRLSLLGSLVEVTVTPGGCAFRLMEGAAVTIVVGGVEQKLKDELTWHWKHGMKSECREK